jgi:hypothetical protein
MRDERADVRERFVAGTRNPATVADVIAFAVTAVVGVVVGLAFAAVTLPLVPVGLVATWLRRLQSLRAA